MTRKALHTPPPVKLPQVTGLTILLAAAILAAALVQCPCLASKETAIPQIPSSINGLEDTPLATYVYGTTGASTEVAAIAGQVKGMAERAEKENPGIKTRVIPDTGFDESMFGSGNLYLYGPYGSNSVIMRWFSDIPVKVDGTAVSIDIDGFEARFESPECGLITLWPQPGDKGYALVYTGVSFKATTNINSVHHGPTDFVIFSGFAKRVGSVWSCGVLGFYDKGAGEGPAGSTCEADVKAPAPKWTLKAEDITQGGRAREFFSRRFGSDFLKPGVPSADVSELVLRSGQKLSGKVFLADRGRIMLKEYLDGEYTGKVTLHALDAIATVNGTTNLESQVYRPALADIMQIVYSEFVDNRHVLSIGPDFDIWQGTEPRWEEGFISTPKLTGPVHDLYGNTLEFTSEWNESRQIHVNRVKYLVPALPGSTCGNNSALLHKDTVQDIGNGVYRYTFNHFPGPQAFVRECFLLPRGTEIVETYPEPVFRTVTEKGTLLTYEWLLAQGEGLFFDLKYRIPGQDNGSGKALKGAGR